MSLPVETLTQVILALDHSVDVHTLRLTSRLFRDIVDGAFHPTTGRPVFATSVTAIKDDASAAKCFIEQLCCLGIAKSMPYLAVHILLSQLGPDSRLPQMLHAVQPCVQRLTTFELSVGTSGDNVLTSTPLFLAPAQHLRKLSLTLTPSCNILRSALRTGWLAHTHMQLRHLSLCGIVIPFPVIFNRVTYLELKVKAYELEEAIAPLPHSVPRLYHLKVKLPRNHFVGDIAAVPTLAPATVAFLRTLPALSLHAYKTHHLRALEPLCAAFGGPALRVWDECSWEQTILGVFPTGSSLRVALRAIPDNDGSGFMIWLAVCNDSREHIFRYRPRRLQPPDFRTVGNSIRDLSIVDTETIKGSFVWMELPNLVRLEVLVPPRKARDFGLVARFRAPQMQTVHVRAAPDAGIVPAVRAVGIPRHIRLSRDMCYALLNAQCVHNLPTCTIIFVSKVDVDPYLLAQLSNRFLIEM